MLTDFPYVQHLEFRFNASVKPHIHHLAYHISVPSSGNFLCLGGVGLDGVWEDPLPPPLLKSEEATQAGEENEFTRDLRCFPLLGVDVLLPLVRRDAAARLIRDSP